MFNEVGSNFFKEEKTRTGNKNKLDNKKTIYLDSGRNAIRLVLDNLKLKDKVAILPSYTCHTVIEPFATRGYKIHYYDVNEDFTINKDEFEKLINKIQPNIILLHAYFGKDTIKNIRQYLTTLRKSETIVIEDITQLLLKEEKDLETADFIVGSIRKWCSVPEGGFVKNNTNIELKIDGCEENRKLVEKKIEASKTKDKYSKTMQSRLKEEYLKLYKEAEDMLEDNIDEIFIMSQYTKELLEKYDFKYIKKKRKENYEYLYENLKEVKGIKNTLGILEADEVPLYYPLFIKEGNRENFQKYMAKNNIYCPIIWPKAGQYLKELQGYNSNNIYKKIICIPCDQRYDLEDMERVVYNIRQFYKEGEQ